MKGAGQSLPPRARRPMRLLAQRLHLGRSGGHRRTVLAQPGNGNHYLTASLPTPRTTRGATHRAESPATYRAFTALDHDASAALPWPDSRPRISAHDRTGARQCSGAERPIRGADSCQADESDDGAKLVQDRRITETEPGQRNMEFEPFGGDDPATMTRSICTLALLTSLGLVGLAPAQAKPEASLDRAEAGAQQVPGACGDRQGADRLPWEPQRAPRR